MIVECWNYVFNGKIFHVPSAYDYFLIDKCGAHLSIREWFNACEAHMPMRKWFYVPNTWDIDLYLTWRPWLPQIFYKKMFFFFWVNTKEFIVDKIYKRKWPYLYFLVWDDAAPRPYLCPFQVPKCFPKHASH